MNRRDFVQKGGIVFGAFLVSGNVFASAEKRARKITILHTNDTHSNIDSFPSNHAKFPNQGGVAKRFELFQKIKSEEENVIILDAGDIFQGTPYFNMFGGVLEMKLMSELGYDAATIGNHDFDGGMDGFLKAKQYAKFPFVCANYDFSETILKDQLLQHVVLERNDIKVGVFGIGVELVGLVPETKYGKTNYLDPIKTANEQAAILKKKGCDLIICLSHLGFEYADNKVSDKVLAAKTKNIHLILGGHTHTFMDKPFESKNLAGETVLINQAGYGGVQVGRLDFCCLDRGFVKKQVLAVK
jgi:5'-nucleotidase